MPSGKRISTGLLQPSFCGRDGAKSALTAKCTMESVEESGQFRPQSRCALVPAKSRISRSPCTVAWTRIAIGSGAPNPSSISTQALAAPLADRRKRAAHIGLRIIHDRARQGGEARGAVALDQRLHAPLAGMAAGDLGPQIAGARLGVADIGGDDVEDGAVGPAGLHQLQGRQDQTLLEDLPAVGCLGAGHLAADIDVMGDGGRNRDDLPLMKDRAEEHDVRRMGAAAIGIVGDQHIALAPRPRAESPAAYAGPPAA